MRHAERLRLFHFLPFLRPGPNTRNPERSRLMRFSGNPTAILSAAVLVFEAGPMSAGTYGWTNLAGVPGGLGNSDGSGSDARFHYPAGIAAAPDGTAYVADSSSHTIRRISASGAVSLFAGKPGQMGSADGTGIDASFNRPVGLTLDGGGNLYVADQQNHTIRRITPAGVVSTIAGSPGQQGAADGNGAAARFQRPQGIAVDGTGNVFVADTGNHTIRTIASDGSVSTLAGSPGNPGNLDGVGAAARFDDPGALGLDDSGLLYVADLDNLSIRTVTGAGVVGTLEVDGPVGETDRTPFGIAVAGDGTVYLADTAGSTLRIISNEGSMSILAGSPSQSGYTDGPGEEARITAPGAIAIGPGGHLWVAGSHVVWTVTPEGWVTTLGGSPPSRGSIGGTGSDARFSRPIAITSDGTGNLFVADTINHTVRRITSGGEVLVLAGTVSVRGSADGTGGAASFDHPSGIAVDGGGNVFVADRFTHTIRKISTVGEVTTLAGLADTQGRTDGNGASARFRTPRGVALDAAGNLYVADSGNHSIRKITGSGTVTTFAGGNPSPGHTDGTGSAARFRDPAGIAATAAGILFVADTGNHTIRKITADGVVSTFAGSPGVEGSSDGSGGEARFSKPAGVAVDSAGNVFVADTGNHTIRRIDSAGMVSTVGGTAGVIGGANGIGAAAGFSSPAGITVTPSGEVVVADTENSRIIRGRPNPVMSRSEWRLIHFKTHENTGSAGDWVDDDHDGIVNLLEWALGLNPAASDQPGQFGRVSPEGFEFHYTRSEGALNAGASYHVEWSDTLAGPGSWSGAGVRQTILWVEGDLQLVRTTLPPGGPGGRFARLRVTAP